MLDVMSAASAMSMLAAVAKFKMPGVDLRIWFVLYPACARKSKAPAVSAAVNFVVRPISFARALSLPNSLVVGRNLDWTLLIAASNSMAT